MTLQQKKDLVALLAKQVTSERLQRFEHVAAQRTNYVTAVFEDIYQAHNASAALRTCDGFGIQNVHIIEQRFSFKPASSVAKGGEKWVNLHYYNQPDTENTKVCFDTLRKQGYVIAATTPHEQDMLIHDIPIKQPIALVFGNEQTGISQYARDHADLFVKIPLYGFIESYNISVSAAICLYELTKQIRASVPCWNLTEDEQISLQLDWLFKTTTIGQQELEKQKKNKN